MDTLNQIKELIKQDKELENILLEYFIERLMF